MKSKQDIRQYITELFSKQNQESYKLKNDLIIKKIDEYLKINTYKHICIYESMNDEVSTILYIQELRDTGYKIYTPQMIGETEMILIDEQYEHYEKEIDVFIIPGRAFSQDGKRLGRGKGYYDRFLSQKIYKKSRKIGVCFDFQIMENIPTEKHDILMHKIFTND